MDTAKLVLRLMDTARSVTPLVAATAATLELTQRSKAGEAVRAQVASRLADGTFRVLVEGKALKLALPPEVKPGDVLELRVVPRNAEPQSASTGVASATIRTLSSAGRLLAAVLAQPQSEPPRQSEPVLRAPPDGPEDLPEPLARAVERSGLFYESHQARWIDGGYPLQRLLEEPQAALHRRELVATENAEAAPDRAPGGDRNAVVPEKPLLASRQHVFEPRLDTTQAQESVTRTAAAPGMIEADSAAPQPEGIAREALPLVRQQLDTLETHQLTWLGDIWPGQPMRWEIGEQAEAGNEMNEGREWRSRFDLRLPALGQVGAELVLSGAHLGIRLTTQDPAAAAVMRAAATELVHALQAAGLQTTGCKVDCDDPSR